MSTEPSPSERIDQAVQWVNHVKYPAIHSGVHFLAANFGSATKSEFAKKFNSEGAHIIAGLISHGYAVYRAKHEDFVLTEAGHRCDRATSQVEARVER